jgi:hypothetical protein
MKNVTRSLVLLSMFVLCVDTADAGLFDLFRRGGDNSCCRPVRYCQPAPKSCAPKAPCSQPAPSSDTVQPESAVPEAPKKLTPSPSDKSKLKA